VWQAFEAFCNRYGNVASVIGLGLSVVGFAVTWIVQYFAKKQVVQIIERIGTRQLESEVSTARNLVRDLRDASNRAQWTRAAEKCQEVESCISILR
jgi:hypothetical protein